VSYSCVEEAALGSSCAVAKRAPEVLLKHVELAPMPQGQRLPSSNHHRRRNVPDGQAYLLGAGDE
jgi:hypothetical protein